LVFDAVAVRQQAPAEEARPGGVGPDHETELLHLMANRRRIKKKIRRAALRYGIDPDVFEAQIGQESGFQQGLTSSAGAKDIAQFIPSTAKQYGPVHAGQLEADGRELQAGPFDL
jgi:soluble lytic murein transglycosylase-like protein